MAPPPTRKRRSSQWPDFLAARVRKLRSRMNDAGLQGFLVTNPVDVRYLCDFPGEDSWALVTARQFYLFSDSRFDQQIDQSCPFVKKILRSGAMADAVAGVFGDLKADTVGIQAEHLTLYAQRKLASKVKDVKLKPTDHWLIEQRAIKDHMELRQIRRALSVQEQAFHQTMDQIQPGMSESEIVALIEYNMRWIGGEGVSFPTIVAIGTNSALPHHIVGRTRVKPTTPILIDFSAVAGGYTGDLTRVVALGGLSRRLTDIYNIVLEAQQAGVDAIAPGAKVKDVDAAARTVIDDAGYGEHFGHGLGHGIGLNVHERPVLSPRATGELVEGNVVTVEPGIYVPGVGGVRIEDDVLVTAKGHRKLSTLPAKLESAII